jgi:SAM-dependent methyltransferase
LSDAEVLSSCLACGGTRLQPLAVPRVWIGDWVFGPLRGRLGLSRCRGCKLVFVNPRPAAHLLDRFYSGDQYSCHAEGDAGAGGRPYAAALLQLLRPYGPPGRLLDYGCGAGVFLAAARNAGWDARGFEPGQRGAASCCSRGLPVVASLAELPDHAFDLITVVHVFEHLPDCGEALEGLRRLVAPGGRVYLEVPNATSLRATLSAPLLSARLGLDERYRAFPIHLTYWTARSLRGLLARHGWRIERQTTQGLGIDELKQDRYRPDPARAADSRGPAGAAPRPGRRFRKWVRDLFLGTGLGENLSVVCRPT